MFGLGAEHLFDPVGTGAVFEGLGDVGANSAAVGSIVVGLDAAEPADARIAPVGV